MSDLHTLVAQEGAKQLATFTADATVKKVLNYLKSSGGGHSLGDTWISFDSSIPAGGVPFCGQLVTRAMYADLFAWAQEQGKVKTESEWQAHASANGGNCPYYSDGDGSTNFRMPAVAAYLKGATSASEGGTYKAQGLPDATGQLGLWGTEKQYSTASGAFSKNSGQMDYGQGHEYGPGLIADFSLANSNPIYGNSQDVTPETYTVLVGVYAGSYSNTGEIDVAALQTAMAALETEVNAKPTPNAYVIETWKSGSNWYRKWSDGFIEQGGVATVGNNKYAPVTFPHPFSNTYYSISGHTDENESNASVLGVKVSYNPVRTNMSCGLVVTWGGGGNGGYMPKGHKVCWTAVGY